MQKRTKAHDGVEFEVPFYERLLAAPLRMPQRGIRRLAPLFAIDREDRRRPYGSQRRTCGSSAPLTAGGASEKRRGATPATVGPASDAANIAVEPACSRRNSIATTTSRWGH